MNVLGGPDDRSSREHRGSMSVTQRDVTKCPSSAAVNSLFVVRPEINRGRYDTGVEFRVCTMIVLKPAAAAGVCLGAFGTSIRRCRRQRVSVDAHVGRRDGCRRGKGLSSSRSLTSRRMLPRIASTRSLSVDGFVDGEFCRRGVSRRGRGYGGVWHGDANEHEIVVGGIHERRSSAGNGV